MIDDSSSMRCSSCTCSTEILKTLSSGSLNARWSLDHMNWDKTLNMSRYVISFIASLHPYLLRSFHLILFTLLLVHLILHTSPHHSHHLCSHHLSLPWSFTLDVKHVSFSSQSSDSIRTAFTDLAPGPDSLGKDACFYIMFRNVCSIQMTDYTQLFSPC